MKFKIYMQINSNPNFKARHINAVQIKKIESLTQTFQNQNANFVELTSKHDLSALSILERRWRTPFVTSLFAEAKEKLCTLKNNGSRFFALTLQENSFENLASQKILGVTEFTDKSAQDLCCLEYLQTKPAYKYKENAQRTTKGIGTAIVNEIIKLTERPHVILYSDPDAVGFYKQYGFVADKSLPNIMHLKK